MTNEQDDKATKRATRAAVRAAAAERRLKAFDLRKLGHSFRQIATELNISHTMARVDVEAVLGELARESKDIAKAYRTMQLARLDDLTKALMPKAAAGDAGAVRALLAVMEREARLLGLDAPTKIDIRGEVEQYAREAGLDAAEMVAEVEAIIAEQRGR